MKWVASRGRAAIQVWGCVTPGVRNRSGSYHNRREATRGHLLDQIFHFAVCMIIVCMLVVFSFCVLVFDAVQSAQPGPYARRRVSSLSFARGSSIPWSRARRRLPSGDAQTPYERVTGPDSKFTVAVPDRRAPLLRSWRSSPRSRTLPSLGTLRVVRGYTTVRRLKPRIRERPRR